MACPDVRCEDGRLFSADARETVSDSTSSYSQCISIQTCCLSNVQWGDGGQPAESTARYGCNEVATSLTTGVSNRPGSGSAALQAYIWYCSLWDWTTKIALASALYLRRLQHC